jgi:NAD+ synthase (glutamine-hydrolysing)
MKIAMAQLNPTVGDFDGNLSKVDDALASVRAASPDLLVLPEMFLTGYPPQDLLERGWFIDAAAEALKSLAQLSTRYPGIGILTGTVLRTGHVIGKGLFNSAVLLLDGRTVAVRSKSLLPTYDVFDEARYFDVAESVASFTFAGEKLGVTICEDAWNDSSLWRSRIYDMDPVEELARQGVKLLINLSASPFYAGKDETRYHLMSGHATRHSMTVLVVNQVGGNDELIFDGHSMCVAPDGSLLKCLPGFEESVQIVDTESAAGSAFVPDEPIASVHAALVLGLRDYVRKCGFTRVLVGLSGGIDSAVVCVLAAEALGPENVLGVTMPSEYSSEGSVTDSRALASNLGIGFERIPVAGIYSSYLDSLAGHLSGDGVGVTEENIQARIRGNILMALSNEHGRLLLSTGNKSEVAVGYCTLYGDMSGGLSVISDVPKTMVYALAQHINRNQEIIPQSTISKPPSAELRPDQTDQDTLPSYDVLDVILDQYVDRGRSRSEIVAGGLDAETVDWVVAAVDRNEHKRRQAAPGLKVTSKAFGMGRRMPIAAKYRP